MMDIFYFLYTQNYTHERLDQALKANEHDSASASILRPIFFLHHFLYLYHQKKEKQEYYTLHRGYEFPKKLSNNLF